MNYFKRYQVFQASKDYHSKKKLLIELYASYLQENKIYENNNNLPAVSATEVKAAEKQAQQEDYTGVAKIFKAVLKKTKKVGLTILLVANLLNSCQVDNYKLVNAFQAQGIENTTIQKLEQEINQNNGLIQQGIQLTQQIKQRDQDKPAYSKTPCYQYTFEYMKLLNPELNPAILADMKMTYKKDITRLSGQESRELSRTSLTEQSELVTLSDLNQKWNLGQEITDPQAVEVGDIINFWVYDLIEFNPAEDNYSYPSTKEDFLQYQQDHPTPENEWRIEEPKLIWGHYAVVSAVDAEWIYLSSSGEKSGPNGIWNGVPMAETEELLTKIRKSDFKFNQLNYDEIRFQRTDDLTQKRARVPLRIEVVRVGPVVI